MSERLDGGEAILEAFRKLGVEYVLSSPGTEWAPVWEAIAKQISQGKNGPRLLDCWHETLAVNIAAGYTLATGRMQDRACSKARWGSTARASPACPWSSSPANP